jgi:hypothetical protein
VAVARCTRLLLEVFALLVVTTPPRLQPFRADGDDVHTAEQLLYGTACGGYRGCIIRGCNIPSRCERMLRLYVSAPCCEAPSSSAVKLNKSLADASRLGANTYCRVSCRTQMQTQSDASMFPTPAPSFSCLRIESENSRGSLPHPFTRRLLICKTPPVGMEC